MTAPPRLALSLMAALWLSVAACGPDAAPFDPDAPYEPSGDPALELGFYYGGGDVYSALAEGDDCQIVWAPQGGTWSMPTLRTEGLSQIADVLCELETVDGEKVGRTETEQEFDTIPEGGVELRDLPIRIRHAAPNKTAPIDDLYGVSATLECTVSDDEGREAEASVGVLLVEAEWGT